MANVNNAAAQAANTTTETVNVQAAPAAAPTFTQEQLDAIVAGAVAAALKQAAAEQAAANKAAADKAAAEKAAADEAAAKQAAFNKAVQEKVAATLAATATKPVEDVKPKVPHLGKTSTPTNVVSREEFEALKRQKTITVNHNWSSYSDGGNYNRRTSDDEIDPWVVGGIVIGVIAVVAGIYYWVLND